MKSPADRGAGRVLKKLPISLGLKLILRQASGLVARERTKDYSRSGDRPQRFEWLRKQRFCKVLCRALLAVVLIMAPRQWPSAPLTAILIGEWVAATSIFLLRHISVIIFLSKIPFLDPGPSPL
jgi:hypothetical protein